MSILKHYTSSGRKYGEGAPMGEMVVNVKDYGAVGGAVSSDGPAFQRAIAACQQLWWGSGGSSGYGEARTGACLYIPAGYYVLTGYEFDIPSSVTIRGDGHGSTFLIWQADLGAGHAAISTYPGQREATVIEGVSIFGPQNTTIQTPGVRALNCDGVVAKAWCHMHECYVTGFGNNIVIDGDHQKFSEVRAERGYYNVYFDARSSANFGDQSFEHCMFDGAGFANIACTGDSMMNHVTFDSVHLGFAPYGIYRENTNSTVAFMIDCVLDNVQFEEQGNGYILDESTGTGDGASSFIGNHMEGCIGFFSGTFKIAARADDYGIKVRTAYNSYIHNDNAFGAGLLPGDIAAIHITNGSINVHGGSPTDLFSPNGDLSNALNYSNSLASGHGYKTSTAATMGDIMQRGTSGFTVQRYDPAYPYLPVVGIAAHDASANEVVVCYDQGETYMLSETVTQGGQWLIPNGASVGHRGQVLTTGTTSVHPAIAISRTSGGASGGALVPVTLFGQGGMWNPGVGSAAESWHNVGGGGEPAFLNSWVNHGGGGYQALRFYKDAFGVVTIQGCIKDGTNVNPCFLLPTGYRPPANLAFPLVAYHTSDARLGIVRVHSDGYVYPETVDGDVSQVWINASFRV